MKLFLVHTMLFNGYIWMNKSGSFLFVMSLWLLVAARNRADSWDPSLIFDPSRSFDENQPRMTPKSQ
jgi:hypothetical protein